MNYSKYEVELYFIKEQQLCSPHDPQTSLSRKNKIVMRNSDSPKHNMPDHSKTQHNTFTHPPPPLQNHLIPKTLEKMTHGGEK